MNTYQNGVDENKEDDEDDEDDDDEDDYDDEGKQEEWLKRANAPA